jgi:DNA polymerase-3 subunit gamma/tau
MSYQVLARKYRPQRFDQIVGHIGTCSALINALEQQKLHHAYLLTGTRGVGKTSLGRLLAKCLNCEEKVTSTPCESCGNCLAIQNNQFADLIEVDAASRTRVEDIQGLLENIQYKPILGRYKIYLIDEVHMLSMHSFSALLKTLEEPPTHVIFLLATTDPQKIPENIISRCVQFPLKKLAIEEITRQLINILDQEKIEYEVIALEKIAKSAKGSVRDALSLLEPVILHGETHQATLKDVQAILGYIDEADQWALIAAIHHGQVGSLRQLIQAIAVQSIDFEQILNDLLETFYQIALTQQITAIPESKIDQVAPQIVIFAKQIHPEQVQLYYQIALLGKKDLSLAPTPQLGFEMTLLRMMAFKPLDRQAIIQTQDITDSSALSLDWPILVQQLPLTGFLKSLALHCSLEGFDSHEVFLLLDPKQKLLYSQEREVLLQDILSQHLKKKIKLRIRIGSTTQITPAALEEEKTHRQQESIYQEILKDPGIKAIQEAFDATIQSETIYVNPRKSYE